MKTLFFSILLCTCLISCKKEVFKKDPLHLPKKEMALTETEFEQIPTAQDTMRLVPLMIGTTKLKENFTPYPECDGGECYTVDFELAVKLNESKTTTIPIKAGGFFRNKNEAKKSDEICGAKEYYKTLNSIESDEVVVLLLDHKIVKIIVPEKWQGKNFQPEIVLWQKS